MMQIIRDKAQGIAAWIIVGIVAFVLCFWGVSGYVSSGKNAVVAKVDGKNITADEIDDIYNRWLRISSMQKGFDPSLVDANTIKHEIATALANQAATLSSLQRDGMAISDNMVVQAIRSKNELQENSKFSMDLYKQFLRQANLAESEFENAVREQLLMSQLQMAVVTSSFATPQEAQRIIALKNQTRDFGYTIIPVAKFMKNAPVTDEQITEFYEAHKAQFMVPEKVQVEYIELSLNDMLKQVEIDDKKLQEFYKANQQAFTEPRRIHIRHIMISAPTISDAAQTGSAKKEIDDIYAKLQKGGNFAELAKKYSEDKLSAQKGGDLGWASANDDYPPAVFALQKNGDFTQPIQSEYGWQIYQLTESKGGGVKDFAAARPALVERFRREEAEKLFSNKGNELANLTFENPTALTVASEKLNLPIQTSEFFTRQGGKGVAASPNVIKAAFSDDVLAQNHNSDLVRMSDDTYLVLRIKDKQPAHQQTQEEVKPEIVAALQQLYGSEQAKHVGDELLAAIKQTNNPNKAASAQSLQWTVKRGVERDSKDVSKDLLARIFILPKPTEGEAYSSGGFTLPNGDYAVVAITKVTNGAMANTNDSNLVDTVGKQIANVEGQLDYAAVQQYLIEQANIKYYNDV